MTVCAPGSDALVKGRVLSCQVGSPRAFSDSHQHGWHVRRHPPPNRRETTQHLNGWGHKWPGRYIGHTSSHGGRGGRHQFWRKAVLSSVGWGRRRRKRKRKRERRGKGGASERARVRRRWRWHWRWRRWSQPRKMIIRGCLQSSTRRHRKSRITDHPTRREATTRRGEREGGAARALLREMKGGRRGWRRWRRRWWRWRRWRWVVVGSVMSSLARCQHQSSWTLGCNFVTVTVGSRTELETVHPVLCVSL